jgi:hypothetical protein
MCDRGRLGRRGESAVKEAMRGRRLSPNGPNEWMMGSFSSSWSDRSSGLLRSLRSLDCELCKRDATLEDDFSTSPELLRRTGDPSSSYTTTALRERVGVKRGDDGGMIDLTAGDGEMGEARRLRSALGLSCKLRRACLLRVGVASSQVCSESVDASSFLSPRGHWTRTRDSWTSIMISASLISDVNVFPLAKSYVFPWQ